MIYRNPQQRVAVLVDVQNLYYSAKNLYNSHVSYKTLLSETVKGRILTRAIAYVIRTPQRLEETFFEAINTSGFEVKEKDLQVFSDGALKGDWDLGIAMDAIRLGHKVDSIILCSGDGDYVPVVNYLQQALGCLVEVAAFRKTANKQLTEICDDFVDFDEIRDKILFRATRKPLLRQKQNRPNVPQQNPQIPAVKPSIAAAPQPQKPGA